jgi:hypothetical protein
VIYYLTPQLTLHGHVEKKPLSQWVKSGELFSGTNLKLRGSLSQVYLSVIDLKLPVKLES